MLSANRFRLFAWIISIISTAPERRALPSMKNDVDNVHDVMATKIDGHS
jgi:hypothetical protein